MQLLDVLARFGFDVECNARLVRHADNKRAKLQALVASGRLEEYQRWQSHPIFHHVDSVVSFMADGAGRAKFWGVYQVGRNRRVPFKRLPKSVPWRWREGFHHYLYDLQPVPGYDVLIDSDFVIEWSSERSWVQLLKDNAVLECPRLGRGHQIAPTPKANDILPPAPGRKEVTTYRILRDTPLARRVKQLHGYRCQICGRTIRLPDGSRYAEAHHIQPLGEPHSGPDITGNIVCVCPNHHVELDYGIGAISIRKLRHVNGHVIDKRYVDYHNRRIKGLLALNRD